MSLPDGASLQVVELQQTLAQKDQALGKLEQSLRLMEEASFDGTFLWKITNVARRCHESACGRTISLFSPGNSPRGTVTRRAGASAGQCVGPVRPGPRITLGPGTVGRLCPDLWPSATHSSQCILKIGIKIVNHSRRLLCERKGAVSQSLCRWGCRR